MCAYTKLSPAVISQVMVSRCGIGILLPGCKRDVSRRQAMSQQNVCCVGPGSVVDVCVNIASVFRYVSVSL